MRDNITETEWAYIAGLLDGEGTVYVSKVKSKENCSGVKFSPVLQISNTHRGVLEWVKERLEGTVQVHNLAGKGKDGLNRKEGYFWVIRFKKAVDIAKKVLPYMIIKKEQTKNLIAFGAQTIDRGNYMDQKRLDELFSYYVKSRQLNWSKLTPEQIEKLRPILRPYKTQPRTKCSVEGCFEYKWASGYCRPHWREFIGNPQYREKVAAKRIEEETRVAQVA